MDNFIELENAGNISIVTVNREKALNALNADLLVELRGLFQRLSSDEKTRVVIITGKGRAFIAGADIEAMSKMTPVEAASFVALGHDTMNSIESCKRPVIAAVNGFCLGGGLELALSCDFIYASDKAKFGLPEVGLGLYPGFGGTQRLARAIGPSKARELIFSGRVIGAEEAYGLGLVNKVSPDASLLDDVKGCASEISSKGPRAVSLAKGVINKGKDQALDVGLEIEKGAFPLCFETEDLKEGLGAFLEKRKPEFKGK